MPNIFQYSPYFQAPQYYQPPTSNGVQMVQNAVQPQAQALDPFAGIPEPFQTWLRNGYTHGRSLVASGVNREKAQVAYHEFHTIYEMLYQTGYEQAAMYFKRLSDAFHALYYGAPVGELSESTTPLF